MSIVLWPAQPAPWVAALREAAKDVPLATPATEAEALAAAPQAEGWIGEITPKMLAAAPKLRWFQTWTMSLERYIFPELAESPTIAITNMRHTYDDHISNHVLAMFLSLCRDFPRLMRHQFANDWLKKEKVDDPITVAHVQERVKVNVLDPGEMTVIVLGLGGIGSEVARKIAAFGSTIVAVDPKLETKPDHIAELAKPEQLTTLLPRAHAVIVCAPLTPQTEGLFDEAMFRKMRPDAIFINIGRGQIVKQAALERALAEGWIGGAGVDVFETEPLPAESPMWQMNNVIVTPHVAGTGGKRTEERRISVVVDNVRRFASGEPLANVVDKKLWY